MPIGNLTSQIFANIYLNELDRFVKHTLRCRRYVRYGDDFIIVEHDVEKLSFFRAHTIAFLNNKLKLEVNPRSDKIMKAKHGLKFLGIKFWPFQRTLLKRNKLRIKNRLHPGNVASYSGLVKQQGNLKSMKRFSWLILGKLKN
mgnify:CR=1 FL=1